MDIKKTSSTRFLMSYWMKDMSERTTQKGADGQKYLNQSNNGIRYSLYCAEAETFSDKVTLRKLHNDRYPRLLQLAKRKYRRKG